MNYGPLSELERDICLLEDVVSDAQDAMTLAKSVMLTPRAVDRFQVALRRAHEVDVQLRKLRVEMVRLIAAAERERKAS